MYNIAVVTPTFNRGNLLKNLYLSLKEQTFKNFEWIIIDDGSTDDTKKIIEEFKHEKQLNINYIYKSNGGKHTALNEAINICQSEMFFIVDSDDKLKPYALEKIINIEKTIDKKEKFCGVAGLKADFQGKLLTNTLDFEILDSNSIDATYKYKLVGDKAEVFYTKILKKYRFPEFKDEKFLTEATVWNKIANDGYKMRWFNQVIYEGEYRNDGLTNDSLNLFLKNSKGNLYYLNQESSFKIPIMYKIKHQANYFRYGLLSNVKITYLINKSTCKYLLPITVLLGVLGVIYTKIKLKSSSF